MASFDFVTIRDTLFTQLAAQLSGIKFYKYPIGDQAITSNAADGTYEFVQLGELKLDRIIDTFGPVGLREDNVDITGLIWVEASGGADSIASNAETRAQTILNLIETGLVVDDTLAGNALVAWISDVTSTNGATERGRAVQLEFVVTIEAHNG